MFRLIYKPSSDAGINVCQQIGKVYTKHWKAKIELLKISEYIRACSFQYFYGREFANVSHALQALKMVSKMYSYE